MDQGHGVHLPGIVATEDGVEHWLPDRYRTVFQAEAAIRAMERRDKLAQVGEAEIETSPDA